MENVRLSFDPTDGGYWLLEGRARDGVWVRLRTEHLSTVARFLGWTKRHADQDPQPTDVCWIAFQAWHADRDLGVDVRKLQQEIQSGQDELLTNKATDAILSAAKTAKVGAQKAGGTHGCAKAGNPRYQGAGAGPCDLGVTRGVAAAPRARSST